MNNSLQCRTRVAILGRPNVGKSTLFNILVGSRKSLVKDQAGVTRDILVSETDIWGKPIDLIDTGGLTEHDDIFSKMIYEQVSGLIESVDLLLVVLDGRSGLCPEDRDVIALAKRSRKPFLTIVNKVDRVGSEDLVKADFYELGVDLVATAFEQRRGIGEIMEWLSERIVEAPAQEKDFVTLAIIGKPNVGKSSLCNYLLKQNRVLVSDIPGTTVDAVDLEFMVGDRKYLLIDTAGLRRQARRAPGVEKLSAFKSQAAIERADIVLLLVDGPQGPSAQDAHIVEGIENKPVILVANKSDLGQEVSGYRDGFRAQVEKVFHFFPDIPIAFISAKTGLGVKKLFEQIDSLWNKVHFRIKTPELNEFFFETIRKAPAPVSGTKNVKFFYLTQTQQTPPSFIAFANFPEGVTPAYRRFLINQIKKRWELDGIPLRIFVMASR